VDLLNNDWKVVEVSQLWTLSRNSISTASQYEKCSQSIHQ